MARSIRESLQKEIRELDGEPTPRFPVTLAETALKAVFPTISPGVSHCQVGRPRLIDVGTRGCLQVAAREHLNVAAHLRRGMVMMSASARARPAGA